MAGERQEIVETTRAFVAALLDVRLGLLVSGWLGNGTASARIRMLFCWLAVVYRLRELTVGSEDAPNIQ